MLASRLFREIYDIALLKRTEEEKRGGQGKREQRAKKGRKTMRGRGWGRGGNGGEGIEGGRERPPSSVLAASEAMEIIFS